MRKLGIQMFCWVAMAGLCLGSPALADCKSDSEQARSMLEHFKQNALANKHPSSEQFQAEFKPLMSRMQQDKCMNELMGLMSFVQAEQQKYPDPRTNPKHYQ